jgi:hypothetical protein
MKFLQIIELTTSNVEEMDKLEAEWQQATEGKRTLVKEYKTRDRDRPNTYLLLAEFPSYEEAMKNNDLPATQEIAAKMAALAEGEMVFRNLDVLEERT